MSAISKKHEDGFYADIVKFVADEPNGIRPGTIGEIQDSIAKEACRLRRWTGPVTRQDIWVPFERGLHHRSCLDPNGVA